MKTNTVVVEFPVPGMVYDLAKIAHNASLGLVPSFGDASGDVSGAEWYAAIAQVLADAVGMQLLPASKPYGHNVALKDWQDPEEKVNPKRVKLGEDARVGWYEANKDLVTRYLG